MSMRGRQGGCLAGGGSEPVGSGLVVTGCAGLDSTAGWLRVRDDYPLSEEISRSRS